MMPRHKDTDTVAPLSPEVMEADSTAVDRSRHAGSLVGPPLATCILVGRSLPTGLRIHEAVSATAEVVTQVSAATKLN